MTDLTPSTEAPGATRDQPGRARVRALVIEPLQADGLARPPRVTAAEHERLLDRMQDRLAYLGDDDLGRLRHLLLADAGGPQRNHWPAWATIRARALALAPPPDEANPIMRSWLHSRQGPLLRDRGGLVETYLFLRAKGRPPGDYEARLLAEEAREAARKRERVIDAIGRGVATDDERNWLAWYDGLAAHCRAVVAAGEAHRRARGEAA